jgi:dihydrofolate reductase
MRKVVLGVAISLDGFIEGPNGEYDWCFNDQDYGLKQFSKSVDAIFMGRKSYDLTKTMGGANPWKGMTTYVFSNTLEPSTDPKVVIMSGDIVKSVKKIKEAPGKNIWLFGGAQLTTAFINENLVDEVWLAVHPIILGSGKPLFQNISSRKKLKLAESKIYDTGLASMTYALV